MSLYPCKLFHKCCIIINLWAHGSRTLANHSFRIMWVPEKGRTDIVEEVEVEVVVPTRVRLQQGAMTECDSVVARCVPGCGLGAGGE